MTNSDILYRRSKVAVASEWHFAELCPSWPRYDFVQSRVVEAEKGDRICPICTRLSVEPPKPKRHADTEGQ